MTAALTILYFIAPGASCLAAGRWRRGTTLFLLHLAGLHAAAVAVTRAGVFPLAALLLWLVYQVILTVSFRPRERAVPAGARRHHPAIRIIAAALCFTPPVLAGYLVADSTALMRVESDRAGPVLQPGDWIAYRKRTAAAVLKPGDLVVARCTRERGNDIVRVMGLPGQEVWKARDKLCTTAGCFPVKRFGDFQAQEGAAAVEVMKDRYHVITHPDGASPAPEGLTLRLGDGEFALLPDNRGSSDETPCRDTFVVHRDDILGVPTWVLFSEELDRIGLAVK